MKIIATHPTQPRRVYPDGTALKLIGSEVYCDCLVIGEQVSTCDLEQLFENADSFPHYNGLMTEQQALVALVQEALENPSSEEEAPWTAGEYVSQGFIRSLAGQAYECIQAHVTLTGWEPPYTPALWKPYTPPVTDPGTGEETAPPWVQPTGAHDAYMMGAKVAHKGREWVSSIDNNVWEPGVYGWQEDLT